MNKLTKIHTAFLNADISRKKIEIRIVSDLSDIVELSLNRVFTKWTDNEKGYIDSYVLNTYYNGTLDQCLAYLQSFAKNENFYKGSDLNEIHHYETNK